MRPDRTTRGIATAVAVAACAAICGCAPKHDDSELRAKIEAARAENARLVEELENLRSENVELQRTVEERLAESSIAGARAMNELRDEVATLSKELAIMRGHAPPPVLVGQELEKRLGHKVDSVKEAVWQSPPSSCVKVLRTIIDKYPNTRAAIKAKGVLANWGMTNVELTESNAGEIDERVRTVLDAQARVWHELQDATWMAEEGRTREAVAVLRKIAEEHPRGTGYQAREILKEWGVGGLDLADIDFDETGPRIQRQATARREVDAAFDQMRRDFPEAAVEAFKRIIKEYPDLRQADRAREGLERAAARLIERERERVEEERRAKRRAEEEARAAERARKKREAERPADAPREKRNDDEHILGDQVF